VIFDLLVRMNSENPAETTTCNPGPD